MNITSKLTLYDTLGILVPGFFILWWFSFFQIDTKPWENVIMITVLSYLIGLIYHRIIECLMVVSKMRRNLNMLKNTWKRVYKDNETPSDIQGKYDTAYTKIARENCLFSVPILEAQETFLRNSILLIFGSVIKLCIEKVDCLYIVLLFALFILTTIIWIQSLHKVFVIVWESEKYLEIVKKKEFTKKD